MIWDTPANPAGIFGVIGKPTPNLCRERMVGKPGANGALWIGEKNALAPTYGG